MDHIDVEYEEVASEPDNDEKEITATNLMLYPETWSMYTIENCQQFGEVVRHFVIYIPFEGRPFVRVWMIGLQPCILRWISLSNMEDVKITRTLKYFFSAFGQPGVVSSLSDKGASILEYMQDAARSVEARGRGDVEDYYWKQKYQSVLVKKLHWKDLSNLENSLLLQSQLEHLPKNWLVDSNDWVHVFAHAVSPEISIAFKKMVVEILAGTGYEIKAGPPKTLDRSLAKCHEYKFTLREDNPQRFENFVSKFVETFGRKPSKEEDWVWNIVDFARCSINVPSAKDVVNVVKIIKEDKTFKVLSLKNGYSKNFNVKGSGYRDCKLLVEVKFENLVLRGIPNVEPVTTLICELQILCAKWLVNKKTTSFSYKILRAKTLRALFKDFTKYRTRELSQDLLAYATFEEAIKHGWCNLVKITNFSASDVDRLLADATVHGWSNEGVSYLIEKLGANIEVRFNAHWTNGITPLISAAIHGKDKLVKLLLLYKCNINATTTGYNSTALHWAVQAGHENVVRTLLQARCDTGIRERNGDTAEGLALKLPQRDQILRMLRGKGPEMVTPERDSEVNELVIAAAEGDIWEYFDAKDVKVSWLSDVFLSKKVVTSREILLLLLYFGGKVQKCDKEQYTALHWAAMYAPVENIQLIIDAKADLNALDGRGHNPIWEAWSMNSKERFFALYRAGSDISISLRNYRNKNLARRRLILLKDHGTDDERKEIEQLLTMHTSYKPKSYIK